MMSQQVSLSFEFFPPATAEMGQQLWQAIEQLAPLDPAFISVTYGAGGSTRKRTHDTVKRILSETNVQPAAHVTCVGASKDEINEVIQDYHEVGVRHIVALRGDPPAGDSQFTAYPQGYANAAELVAGIKTIADFDISVAAYPEQHPESPSLQADLDNLKRKIDAGANRCITQFFFDIDLYCRFVDRARAAGINVPIIPGILPVTNFERLKGFAKRCGTSLPSWLKQLFKGLDASPSIRRLIAASVAISQCRELFDKGVRDFHFYTLNRAELTQAICHVLKVRAATQPSQDHNKKVA